MGPPVLSAGFPAGCLHPHRIDCFSIQFLPRAGVMTSGWPQLQGRDMQWMCEQGKWQMPPLPQFPVSPPLFIWTIWDFSGYGGVPEAPRANGDCDCL